MTRRLSLVTAAFVIAGCNRAPVRAEQPARNQPADYSLDSTLTRAVTEAGIVGLATAVIVDGRVVWTRAYGFADRDTQTPLTTRTVMNLASVSKTTIGVSMMRLVAEGKLSLDENINQYLPFEVRNPNHPDARITLRHLATHTSGITDRRDFYASLYRPVDEPDMALDSLLRSYLVAGGSNYSTDNFLTVAPGRSRDYSNLAATLAAYIVQRAAGESFDAHTRRVIFAPLGMKSAGWFWSQVDSTVHSRLYEQDSTSTNRVAHYELTSYPDGGLRMSVDDLSRYFAMLLNNGTLDGVLIIDSASLAEMKRFHWTTTNKPDDYELTEGNTGLFWRTKFNGQRIGHGGNDPGVSVEMLTDAAGRVGIIYMSNTSLYRVANRHLNTIIDALTSYGEALAAANGAQVSP